MDFKNYFLYQADYQHWASDVTFNALDRLEEASRMQPDTLYFGSIQDSVEHLTYFYCKWLARLQGQAFTATFARAQPADWRTIKNDLRQVLRSLQSWLQHQPEPFFDSHLSYQHTLNHQEEGVWVRDALTHIFTYGATERGRISAAASAMGAPCPDLRYTSYRAEMGEHLVNLRKREQ